jgi:hypothetical protein
MTQGVSTTFGPDRFNQPNSALNLNGGYAQVPAGYYFDTPQFTVSLWVKPISVGWWARVIDFGNGQSSDNVILSLDSGSNNKPGFRFYKGSSIEGGSLSNSALGQNQWQLLTATYDGTSLNIYINGVLTGSNSASFVPSTIFRTNCYIGKSNWADGYSSSLFDDLRFYNISLAQSQINDLMNENGTDFCPTTTTTSTLSSTSTKTSSIPLTTTSTTTLATSTMTSTETLTTTLTSSSTSTTAIASTTSSPEKIILTSINNDDDCDLVEYTEQEISAILKERSEAVVLAIAKIDENKKAKLKELNIKFAIPDGVKKTVGYLSLIGFGVIIVLILLNDFLRFYRFWFGRNPEPAQVPHIPRIERPVYVP